MVNVQRIVIAVLGCMLAIFVVSCGSEEAPRDKPQLLIYCGITMSRPMNEIAQVIEQRHGCTIRLTKGGSGNLQHAIEINKIGDLYLPGSASYIEACLEKGLIGRVAWVGCNQAALIVPEGNPRNLTNDPAQLINPDLGVVLADPESGSIGREAVRILKRRGCQDQALKNVIFFTTDSKNISLAVKNGEADVAINWMATSQWPENKNLIDGLPIDPLYAQRQALLLGLLNFSEHREVAEAFMDYAEGPAGREIFRRYGFLAGAENCTGRVTEED